MRTAARFKVGVLGVGTIASAMVEALLTGPHAGDIDVVLSPRSARRSAELARVFPGVVVAADNQEVLDTSEIVLLAVLPIQISEACLGLNFRSDHVVASLAAGWAPSRLASLLAPAHRICQLIPVPTIRTHEGPIVMAPDIDVVRELLAGCGDIVALDNEADTMALSCASATMSTFFAFQMAIIDWVVAQGLPQGLTKDYVGSLFRALAGETVEVPLDQVHALVQDHETVGGLNEQVRLALARRGAFSELTRQFDLLRRERVQT